jgi:hypothetical protein
VIIQAALCPAPPLLARELTGTASVLPELRAACLDATAALLAAEPDVVVVVGGGPATQAWPPDGGLDVAAFAPALGSDGTRPRVPLPLPLPLGLGAMLLDEAGYAGPRSLRAVSDAEPAAASAPGWPTRRRRWLC